MQTTSSKFWAYIAVIVGILLMLLGLAALIGYFGLSSFLLVGDLLSYNLGQIAAIFLGLFCGPLAIYHGMSSISNRPSSKLRLPPFYIFWIILGLVLGLGTLIINTNIAILHQHFYFRHSSYSARPYPHSLCLPGHITKWDSPLPGGRHLWHSFVAARLPSWLPSFWKRLCPTSHIS